MLPLRNHLLHDLITKVFLRSVQYGITVMDSLLMNLTWPKLHSLAILLLIYSATRKVLTIQYDASSGTIAGRNVSFVFDMVPLSQL